MLKLSRCILEINKMLKSTFPLVALIVLLHAVCFSASATSPSSPPTAVNSTDARTRLDKGCTALTGEFLYQMVSSHSDKNGVSSATSVLIPLAQLALWATGLVLEQLLKLFNLNNKDEIKGTFSELTKSYKNTQNVDFLVATKYYVNDNFPLTQNFKRDSEKYFDAEGENLDFSDKVAAANIINDWVSNSTRGKIQDLVSADMFNSATRLVLVNAIYFYGKWVYQFNSNDTKIKDFHKSNGKTVSVNMMYQENNFMYTETHKYQALQMFYEGGAFSFLVILPKDPKDLLETVEIFRDPNELDNLRNSLQTKKVQVYFPKILIESQLDMGEMLKKANVTAMFNPANNGFEGILKKKEPLYVSTAIQKAYVSISELGTEAAVATAIGLVATAAFINPPKVYEFNADHPFMYYIFLDDVPMFSGYYVGDQ